MYFSVMTEVSWDIQLGIWLLHKDEAILLTWNILSECSLRSVFNGCSEPLELNCKLVVNNSTRHCWILHKQLWICSDPEQRGDSHIAEENWMAFKFRCSEWNRIPKYFHRFFLAGLVFTVWLHVEWCKHATVFMLLLLISLYCLKYFSSESKLESTSS